jgi:hypothetical protein
MIRKNLTETEFKEVVANSKSIADVCRGLGIVPKGGNYKTVNQLLKKYSADTSHFTGGAWNQGDRYRPIMMPTPIEKILIKGSVYSSYALKNRLFKEGFKEQCCECCGLEYWLEQPIKLELHHVNGDNNDNRIENLQILCPNCHAYTDNYRGANKVSKSAPSEEWLNRPAYTKKDESNKIKRVVRPKVEAIAKQCKTCGEDYFGTNKNYCSLDCYKDDKGSDIPKVPELIDKYKELGSMVAMGKFYGVSDNAVRKWCIRYGILELMKSDSKKIETLTFN